ncbi:MAG: thiamine pyrophosphate-binding protein, partial [Gammaproteobacteria bacterium]|nr:thiamine pyrophosphate-binding protein [Gammaproteobacteria bacterium]
MHNSPSLSCGQTLVKLLEAYGTDTIFGIPGVHTVELYRELPNTSIRHITPRHEQGAGFMADGYARTSGRPGICFLITGPGITNAATALAQAYSDSVPVLAISSVNRTGTLRRGLGCLHELPSQRNLTAQFTAFSHTVLTPDELPAVIAEAFAVFGSRRPRPVHIEIPIDVLTQPGRVTTAAASAPSRPAPDSSVTREIGNLLKGAAAPVVILGGGARDAGPVATQLIDRLGAPVLLTVAAKGIIDERHPLCVGAALQFAPVQSLIEAADVVLAVG